MLTSRTQLVREIQEFILGEIEFSTRFVGLENLAVILRSGGIWRSLRATVDIATTCSWETCCKITVDSDLRESSFAWSTMHLSQLRISLPFRPRVLNVRKRANCHVQQGDRDALPAVQGKLKEKKWLSRAAEILLRTQVSHAEELHVQWKGSNLHASARKAVYRGLHIHRADLECPDLKLSLGPLALAQGKILQQETKFLLQIELVEEGLAQSIDSPLLGSLLRDWKSEAYVETETDNSSASSAWVQLQEGWCAINYSLPASSEECSLQFCLNIRGSERDLLVVTFADGRELEYALGDRARIHALEMAGGKLFCCLELVATP